MQCLKCGWTVMNGVQALLLRLDAVQPLIEPMYLDRPILYVDFNAQKMNKLNILA